MTKEIEKEEYLSLERRGRVAIIRFTRPAMLNILNRAAIAALHSALQSLSQAEKLGAVVITGSGRAFIGGADVREMRDLDPATATEFISELHAALSLLRTLNVPVIAAVNGYALGAGCELVAACDLRLAATEAIFGMPEIKVGIPSVIEAALLVSLVGLGNAAELVLTGEPIDAAEAERMGLVNQVVPAEKLEETALALAAKIASYSPQAVQLQKQLLNAWQTQSLEAAMTGSIESFAAAFKTKEPHEAMTAFLEKRPAKFETE